MLAIEGKQFSAIRRFPMERIRSMERNAAKMDIHSHDEELYAGIKQQLTVGHGWPLMS